jgi:hypothetical protein
VGKSIYIAMAMLAMAPSAWAQKPSVYPAKGQSAQQQGTDDTQCLGWAKQNTGIDPTAVAATPSPQTAPQGERMRGAVRGATAGAVIGEVANDDASKGAATGAAVGVLAGGRQARQKKAAQAQQAEAAKAQALDTYYRAYGACMQGRGYSVK